MRARALLLVAAGCACSTAPTRDIAIDESRIDVVTLVATVEGRAVPDVPASSEPPRARVSWNDGEVIFFAHHTECARTLRHRRVVALAPIDESAEPDVRESMIRIDFKSAEVIALERGRDPDALVPWVLVGPKHVAPEERGRQFARELLRANVADHVRVAAVPFGDVELVLLPNGGEREMTDLFPLRIRGPHADPLPAALDVLMDGPPRARAAATHARTTVVSVTRGAEHVIWEAPDDVDTEQAQQWSAAFAAFAGALTNGCVVP